MPAAVQALFFISHHILGRSTGIFPYKEAHMDEKMARMAQQLKNNPALLGQLMQSQDGQALMRHSPPPTATRQRWPP